MKKYFLMGLVIVLPLTLTLLIIAFIFNTLTAPFAGVVKDIFNHYGIWQKGFLFLSAAQVQNVMSQLLILIMLFCSILAIGMIARWFFFRSLVKLGEKIFAQIPFVRAIYKTTKDVIHSIFSTDTRSFKQVVMVPFPNPNAYCVGLVTREKLLPLANGEERIAVFVPTTPNPTSGFLVLYKQEELIYLDMTVENAFKYVISCGVLMAPFRQVTRQQAEKILEDERVTP